VPVRPRAVPGGLEDNIAATSPAPPQTPPPDTARSARR
jgi:hypothetical protein